MTAPYRHRLTAISIKSQEMSVGDLTVFVGSNNSGKTRALRGINDLLSGERPGPTIVTRVRTTAPSDLESMVSSYGIVQVAEGDISTFHGVLDDLRTVDRVIAAHSHLEKLTFSLAPFMSANLTTSTRLRLASRYRVDDAKITSPLQMLYDGGRAFERLLQDEIDRTGIGVRVALDFSLPGTLCFRVLPEGVVVDIPHDPREAAAILQSWPTLDEQGDGIRSLIGTIIALLLERRSIIFIDEPELFLHPPQAFQMGQLLGRRAKEGKQIVISTHSTDLLRGLLASPTVPQVVRLERRRGEYTYCVVDTNKLSAIAADSMLGSNRVLEGLFYQGTVVVEADADALFYSRVAQKVGPGHDVHYVRAHNKQTLARIVAPLREFGVAVACIADFDVLRVKSEFKSLLNALGANDDRVSEVLGARDTLCQSLETSTPGQRLGRMAERIRELLNAWPRADHDPERGLESVHRSLRDISDERDEWLTAKRRGQGALVTAGRRAFEKLDSVCRDLGLFIVPVGELESWLTDYGLDHAKSKAWLGNALQLVAALPAAIDRGPWKFVAAIHSHLSGGRIKQSKSSEVDSGAIEMASAPPVTDHPAKTDADSSKVPASGGPRGSSASAMATSRAGIPGSTPLVQLGRDSRWSRIKRWIRALFGMKIP